MSDGGPRRPGAAGTAAICALAVLAAGCAANTAYPPFWWTPHSKVEVMLELAQVTADDVVYDLGSGDGRIVIAAAERNGARGVGIEIDAALVEESERNAREAGVEGRVRFLRQDFYEADIREASVVTLYLFEETNALLKPVFLEQLSPDARIVTYKYRIPGWTPLERHRRVFLYALPEKD